jgi:hypothetical protein
MPIYAIVIVLLISLVSYLIYKLEKARKEKVILLIKSRLFDNTWEVYDSAIEANAAIKDHQKKNEQSRDSFRYCKIRTTSYMLLNTGYIKNAVL